MFNIVIIVTLISAFLVTFIRWFFDPYFRYNNRILVKEISFFENGKTTDAKNPFILEKLD